MTIVILFCPAQNEKALLDLEEGVWSLGGEAGFVLAAQHPVGQRELDLGVLQESNKRGKFRRQNIATNFSLVICCQFLNRQV